MFGFKSDGQFQRHRNTVKILPGSVPKEQPGIARHFNVGIDLESVESSRDGRKWLCVSAVPVGLFATPPNPGVEMPGYFQNLPAGHRNFRRPRSAKRMEILRPRSKLVPATIFRNGAAFSFSAKPMRMYIVNSDSIDNRSWQEDHKNR